MPLGLTDERPEALAMAAFRTWARGGLIPHARHGGSCVYGLAVAASKFEGTGFEYEQIGQTHVALVGLGVLDVPWARVSGLDVLAICGVAELRGEA